MFKRGFCAIYSNLVIQDNTCFYPNPYKHLYCTFDVIIVHMWPLRKQMRKPFVTTLSRVCKKNSPKKRTRVCLYTGKKFFYQNERGEIIHFFVAEIDEYLLLLLLYLLCPLLSSKHIFI